MSISALKLGATGEVANDMVKFCTQMTGIQGRMFFFEKKNQKTFVGCGRWRGRGQLGRGSHAARARKEQKFFWFFFFKKRTASF
jgi:hypothetical protein